MTQHEQLYHDAIDRFGIRAQVDKAIEECSELTKELLHHRQRRNIVNDVAEEIADVMIMCE